MQLVSATYLNTVLYPHLYLHTVQHIVGQLEVLTRTVSLFEERLSHTENKVRRIPITELKKNICSSMAYDLASFRDVDHHKPQQRTVMPIITGHSSCILYVDIIQCNIHPCSVAFAGLPNSCILVVRSIAAPRCGSRNISRLSQGAQVEYDRRITARTPSSSQREHPPQLKLIVLF